MRKPSIWYWVICVLGLLWSLGGGYDYLMTVTENADYMARVPAETLEYYNGFPNWLLWPWAIAIWGGVLGWVLMLLRLKLAIPVFLVALGGLVINMIYFGLTGGYSIMGLMGTIMMGVVLAISVFALWFARRSRAKGTLK